MKKVTSIILAVVLIASVLFIYISFNGNFISKAIAKNTIEKYVTTHYLEGSYELAFRSFNFKDKTYMFDFTYIHGSYSWSYTLEAGSGFNPKNIETITMHVDSADYETSEQWSGEGTTYLRKLLADQPGIQSIGYSIAVPKNFTQIEASWSPAIAVPVAPDLYFELEYINQTEDEVLQAAQQLKKILDEDALSYRFANINIYEEINNEDGHKKGYASTYYEGRYRISFEPGKVLTIDDVR